MKANMKGLGGIKHLFLAHGEKLGIVIVGAIAVMMIFKSMSRERLSEDKGADDLQQKITQARSSMESFNWERAKQEFPDQVRVIQTLETKGTGAIDRLKYKTKYSDIPWDASPVPPVVLRSDPVLLDPQGLEASGGAGLLAFVDPIVRRQKMLEEQQKAAKAAAEQKKQADEMAKAEERGGNRARGGPEQGPEAGMFDPLHPKRRPVVGMTRPRGVPLQDYEEVRTAYWAVVVAKVPIKEQVKLYRDAFEKARGYNPTSDLPQYLGYFVERAEVRSGEEDAELKWQPVSVYNGRGQRIGPAVTSDILFGKGEDPTAPTKKEAVVTKWVSPMPEIVDGRFLEGGSLAFPLPPLVGRDWGREVTHSEIPLAADGVELEEDKEKAKADEAKPDEKEEPEDPFARSAANNMAGGQGPMGARGMEGGFGRGPMGGPMGMGGRGGEFSGMRGGPGMMGMGRGMEGGGFGGEMGMAGGYSGAGGFDQNGEPRAPSWLLRFFDFSVEPGKKYQYRVRLVMSDPNYRVSLDELDSDAITRVRAAKKAKKSYILTEWSKPSRPVSIPLAGSVFVASAKAPSDRANDEPRTTLLVESFGMNQGKAIQAAKEKDFVRGSVANMIEDAEILVDQGRAIDPYDDFKFQTDITVADIRGGERLTRDQMRPARVLMMGPAGQLFVQEETEDLEIVEDHRTTFAKESKDGLGAPGFMGEGGGRGFPGGMMGRGER